MDQLNIVQLEIIYSVLLHESDIEHYCLNNEIEIHDTDSFWLNKLDHDFGKKLDNGVVYIPSDYVRKYSHTDSINRDIYRRWRIDMKEIYRTFGRGDLIAYHGCGNDIIMFILDIGKYDNYILEFLYHICIECITIDVMNELEKLGWERNSYSVNTAMKYSRLDILEWFEERNILPTRGGILYAIHGSKLDALNWLEHRNILPDCSMANHAVYYRLFKVLDWLLEKNILPDEDAINHASVRGDINMLEWLEKANMFPNDDNTNRAVTNQKYNIL